MHFHGGRARRKLPLVVTQQHLVGPTDGVGCKEDQHLFRGCRQSWLWGIEAAPACDAGVGSTGRAAALRAVERESGCSGWISRATRT